MLRIACFIWRAAGSFAIAIPTSRDLFPSKTLINFTAAGFSLSVDFLVSNFRLVKSVTSWS